jgi:hypothetical protein
MPIVDVNGQKGFVPDANLDGFLKDYPDANIHYAINGQTWAVPAKNTKKLLQKFPDAAPLTGGIETPKDLAIPHDQVGFQGSLTAPDLNPEQGYHPINKTGTPSVVPMPIPSSISDQPIFNQPQEPALKVAPYQNENLKGAESKALVNTAYNNLNSSISKTGEQAYNASGFNKNTHLGSPMSEDAGSLTNAILGIQAYNKSIDPATFIPQKIDELQPYIQNEALQELQNDPNYLNLKNTGQLTPDLQQKLVSDKLAQKTQQAYDTILQKGYIQPNMPTSWADDIIKGAVNQSMIGMGYNLATNVESGSLLAAKQQALKDYNPNIVESALSMAGGFILDSPFFAVGGEVTSAATDAIANQVLKQSTKGLLENGVLGVNPESLARLLSPAEKGIIKGSEYAGQGLTMANYNQAKSDLGQLLDINEGVKSIGDFKPFDVKKYFEDFGMFSMLGFAGGAVYGAAQKAKEAIGGLAGNLTARAIQVGDVAAQSASFTAVSALENPNTHFNAFKDFESNFLMFATMGAQHLIGGVEGVRKPRPENAAQKKMYDFMDNNLKGNNDILNSINFTQEEQNALSPLSKATDLKSAIIDLSNQSVKDKDLAKKVDDLLTNKDVPFSLKSKLYYAISGDMLSIPTIGTHAVIPDNDMYTVEARDRAGNLIEKKPNLSLEDATNIDRDYDEMKKDQDGFMLERSLGNTDAVTNIMKDVAKKEEIPIDDISKIFAKEPKDRTDKERQITQSYISELLKNVKPSKNNILLSDYDNITNAQRKSIVDNYDKSLHNFDDTFGKDAEQMKGQVDSGNYEDYWMTKGQKDAVNKYVKTKKDYDGFLNHVKNNLDKTIEKLHKSIDLLTNKDTGHVTEVKFNGQNYTVSDGKLAISVDENVVKEIDNKNSSDIIALRDVNGNIISASIKDSNLELQSDTDAKELKQSVVDQARNKAVEDIKSSIDYNKGEQLFYTKDGKTTNVTFDQAHPDDDKAIVFDMEKTPKIINGVPQYERMIVDRSMLSTEKIPPVEEEKSTEGTTEIKELPKDDKGNISWNEMTPEEILRTLRSQMDDENVIGSIDETIDKATKELDKVSKKKITGDVDTRMKNIEEKNSKMSSLQKRIDHFNKVKELTTKTNENATKNGKIEQDSIEKHQNGNGIVQENGETGNVAPENSQESTETGDSNSVQKGGEKINTNIDVPDNTPLEDVPFQIISEEEGNKEKTNEQVEKIDQEKAMGNPTKYDQPFKTNDEKNYDTLVGILHRHFPKNNTATAEEFKAAVDKMLTSPRVLILKEMQSIKDNAVKDGTFMKAPNGNDTKLTETQWLQVRTDNFKNWFGDWLTDPEHASKVVDENGEPLVVYHGSPNKFNVFNLDKIGSQGTTEGQGFYFTPDRSISDGYSERRGEGEGSLFSLYLNIRNPYSNEVKTFTKSNIKKILLELYSHDKEALSNFGDVGYEGFNKILNDAVNLMNEDESDTSIIGGLINGGVASVEDVLKAVKKVTKKDGVITSWKSDEKETPIYITIDPTDIKSTIDNNGEFDANNPDIRMQIIGEQGAKNLDKFDKGTRLESLRAAKAMEGTPIEIKAATGWEKGSDGLWRYETPDLKLNDEIQKAIDNDPKGGFATWEAKYREKHDGKSPIIKDIIGKDDPLLKAFPELGDHWASTYPASQMDGATGYLNSHGNVIMSSDLTKGDSQDVRRVLIHELQHYIQHKEGFSTGTNLDNEVERGGLSKEKMMLLQGAYMAPEKDKKEIIDGLGNLVDMEAISPEEAKDIKTIIEKGDDAIKKELDTPFQRYKRSAGEVEARNASEKRANMTPEEKRHRLIDETSDVAPEDQIHTRDEYLNSESRNVSPTGFYSPTEEALGRIQQEKGTKEQFKQMLLKNGAKQAELDWMGFDQLPDKLTKSDIQKWINENKIDVKDVELDSNNGAITDELNDDAEEELDRLDTIQKRWDSIESALANDYELSEKDQERLDKYIEEFDDIDGVSQAIYNLQDESNNYKVDETGDTKFSQYTLPGGEKYKELLLTMPEKKGDTFKSSHFDEPNILAHVRFDERTVNGEKVLFIEEFQSDWAQKGKKEGFKVKTTELPIGTTIDKNEFGLFNINVGGITKYEDFKSEKEAKDFVLNAINKVNTNVPDMPFKKTDQWVNLAFRRMMRYAAENGFDRIAWTNGEQQADRYNLSKQVDEILYSKNEDGTYAISAIQQRIGKMLGESIPENKIEDYVGKEVAKKIISGEGNDTETQGKYKTMKSLSGNGLKVGGEGMKGFYDQIVPKVAKDLGKPFDAKVETINIPETGEQQSLPVTDKMKESVKQGVPLFARTPDGTIYGFVKDGTIYLNPAKMNANTPIHEYGHLWLIHIEKTDPALHARGVELIKDSPYYTQVKNDRNYQGLDETGIVDEALARAIGDKGEQIVNNLGLKDKLKAWISDFWKAISSKFGIKLTPDQLQDLTLDQFTDYANANLLGDDVISENKVETDNKMQIDDLDNPDETYTKDIDKLIEQRAKESERLARILSSEPQRPILNREMGEDALSYAKRVQDAEKTFNKEHAIWNKSRDELSKNAEKLAKKFGSSFPRQDTGESNEDFRKRLKKYLDEVPKEGINQEGGLSIENGKTLLKSINTLFNNGDEETKAVIREFSGDFNRRMETATFNLKKAFRAFAKMSRGDMLKFIDNMEHGKKQDTDILQVYSDQLRATLDKAREAVRGLGIGKLEEFIEYYFPHRYKGKKTDFLKHRNYEYLKDAINAGLEPQDYNPVVSTLKHVRDMYRFVFAHKAMTDLVSTGTVVFVRAGESAPELKDGHFVELPRALSTIYSVHKVEKGRYYALPEVAKIFERYQSRGWEDNSLYRLARGINNIGNQLQLGLSAFHVGFTSLDTIVSRNALALEYLLHGKIGRGLWEMFPLNSLITPATNYYRGKQLQNVFIGKTMADNYKMVVAATGLQMANGRAHMDAIYGDQMWNKMMENLHSKTVGGVLTSIPQGLIAVLEAPGKFIMENIVPRQKLGVFYDMMMYELRVHPNMDVPQFREAAQRAWDSVDNRLGQLTYDNLFWNESVKDALMLTFRSVGWNLGTIREIGGAVLELLHTVSHRPKNDIETHKAAYVASLMFTTAMMSSIYQYLATKKAPSSALDLVAPQNGGVDNFGNPTRSMLPSYMGQIFSAHYYGLNEVANKFSPLLTGIIENIENKDFYGAEIRRSDMELRDIKGVIKYAAQLGWDELKYVLKDVIPLSIKNLQQQQVSPMAQKIAVMFGIKSAITPLNRTAAENELLALYGEMAPQAPKTQDKIDTNDLLYQLRGQYLNSDVQGKEKIREQAIQALKDKTISPIEYKRIIAPINENPLGQLLMSYKITGDQAYENFIGYQTKEERSKTYQIVINKLKKEFVKSSLDKRKNINIYLGNIYNILKDEGIKTQQQAAN